MKAEIRLKSASRVTVLRMTMIMQVTARPKTVCVARPKRKYSVHYPQNQMQADHATWTHAPARIQTVSRHLAVTRCGMQPRMRSQCDKIAELHFAGGLNVVIDRFCRSSVQAVATVGCGLVMLLLTVTWQPANASSQELALTESR